MVVYLISVCFLFSKMATMSVGQQETLDDLLFSVTFPDSPLPLMRDIRASCLKLPAPHMVPVTSCEARVEYLPASNEVKQGLDDGQHLDKERPEGASNRRMTCAAEIVLHVKLCGADCKSVERNEALVLSAAYTSPGDPCSVFEESSFREVCGENLKNVFARVNFFDRGEEVQGPAGQAYLELESRTSHGKRSFTFVIDSTSWDTGHL